MISLEIIVLNLSGRGRRNMRILANSVILLLMVWALSVSALAFLDITIHFPWVISDSDSIPFHRLQAMRIGIMLTFSYYGLLHLIGKSQEFYPLHFLTTYLFYMLISGLIIFYRRDVLMQEWGVLLFFWSLPYFLLPCCQAGDK